MCRMSLGWTRRGTAYCQLIRAANKEKRLAWAQKHLHEATTGFLDVIWTDECTVQMETYRRFCCRKDGQPPHKPCNHYYYSIIILHLNWNWVAS